MTRTRHAMSVHRGCGIVLLACLLAASPSFAEGPFSASGSLDLRGIDAQYGDSVKEGPGGVGRIKLDADGPTWKFHSWLEGGWDGSVRGPVQDHSLFKSYDRVYQDNTRYFEFKEFYLSHSSNELDLRIGVQRFSWGRLDEYPVNDLLNPWDYTQFLGKPLEDRKIGAPAISASVKKHDWSYDLVWEPWLVPYRLSMPYERWSGIPPSALSQVPNAEIVPDEPNLPPHTLENGNAGLRARKTGDIEWSFSVFHGFDPRPVFRTTTLVIQPGADVVTIDPGYVPVFHKITALGLDAAAVNGNWSLRFEAAYTFNRYFNIQRSLWGYPTVPAPGAYPLDPIEVRSDTVDYGMAADYRLFEDGLLTMQAQQTIILSRPETLYERTIETLLWMNLKAGWLNQKVETNASIAYNPEHGDGMAKANAWYVFSDRWKAGLTALSMTGPPQSLFGRYSRNDQAEAELRYAW